MKKFYRTGAAVLAAAVMVGSLAACGPKDPDQSTASGGAVDAKDNWSYQYDVPTAESLLSTGDKQNRYLSMPDSRVVINPFNFESQSRETTQVQYSNRSTMPLNFGFCDPFKGESRGVELPNVMMMANKNASSSQGGGIETVWEANLKNAAGWDFSSIPGTECTVDFHGDSATIGVTEASQINWQHMEALVKMDIKNAYLTVTIDELSAGGYFAIKFTDDPTQDITLVETMKAGTYTFRFEDYVDGWEGEKQFWVKVFAIGKGKSVTFSNMYIQQGDRVYDDAAEFSTTWRPDQLGFEASYPGNVNVTGTDFFYDEKTVVRDMTVTGSQNGFLLYGEYNGTATADGRTVLVNCGNFKYAVTPSAEGKFVFYPSMAAATAGGAGSDTSSGTYGVWAYQMDTLPEKGVLRVAVSFDTKEAADADVIALSQKPGDDCAEKLAERTRQWDDLLSRVPRPGTFELQTVDAKGVTAGDVKQSYYEAWAQVISNVLPPNPELDFNYRIMATGKASLWGYGSPKCSYAATWDALYGIAIYSQIDPDAAWDMYKGLMSLVGDDGQIAGESLPPNNARVAWMLYTAKPDKAALEEIQPALERHLTWRFNNPRWIYLDVTPDALQKDIDFVASALIDVQYLMKINEELGLESENEKWVERNEKLYKNMKLWFFSPVTEYPVQYFTMNGNKRSQGNPSWVTKALHVPDVQQSEVDDMMRLFRSIYKPNLPFCGLGGIKYEPYNYTLVGLAEHGYMDEARTMAEVAVRDITLSGIHSEGYNYSGTETVPLPEGVRPSLFGVNMLIDCVWMMNGVRMDDGMPALSNYFSYDGGLENYKINGKTFNVKKEGNTYTYGGSYVGEENKTMEVEADKLAFPFEGTNVLSLGA